MRGAQSRRRRRLGWAAAALISLPIVRHGSPEDETAQQPGHELGSRTRMAGKRWSSVGSNVAGRGFGTTTLKRFYMLLVSLSEILTFGMVSTDMYYLNKVMSTLFLETPLSELDDTDFKSIASVTDFWKYVEGPLVDGLYWDTFYPSSTTPVHHGDSTSHIYYENLLLGVVQVRQLKICNDTCSIYPSFRAFMKECYGPYYYASEDKEPFGLKNDTDNGGFTFTLPKSKNASIDKLSYLKERGWLTRGTRVVFIDFSMYNANVNLFCIVSFIIQEFLKMKTLKKDYVKNAWNWLDVLLILLSVFAIAFNVYRTMEVARLMKNLLSNSFAYPDFYFLAFWQTRYNNMISVNVFFAWIKVLLTIAKPINDVSILYCEGKLQKIFKYISFNKTMTQLSSTLSRCAKDIIGFAIMFFIIFFAYAQLGYLVFGSQVDEFSTFQNCIFTQFRIVLGDFNFASIEQANRILGPIYFITFVFFVFFVLLNMFLAIINDTYSEVKADFSVIPSREFEISDLIRQSYNKALVKLKLKSASQTEDLYTVRLSRYTAELEKQLKHVTSRLDLIMKNLPEGSGSGDKK
ncbi:UNVERIFIED_CONTAM: hypothetical protein K2H54_034724 [Gekko kuhli]